MHGELLTLFSKFLGAINIITLKKIDTDIFALGLIVGTITLLSVIKRMKNNGEIDYKRLINKDTVKIGIAGSFVFLMKIFILKRLPMTFVVPIGLSWMVFSVLFSKYMLNEDVTVDKLIKIAAVIIGALIMQWHHIGSSSMNITKSIIVMLFFYLLSRVAKAYQLAKIKSLSDTYSDDELLFTDYSVALIVNVLVFIFYKMRNGFNFGDKRSLYIAIIFLGLMNIIRVQIRMKAISGTSSTVYAILNNSGLIYVVILSHLFLNEKMRYNQFIGIAIIMLGIASINSVGI